MRLRIEYLIPLFLIMETYLFCQNSASHRIKIKIRKKHSIKIIYTSQNQEVRGEQELSWIGNGSAKKVTSSQTFENHIRRVSSTEFEMMAPLKVRVNDLHIFKLPDSDIRRKWVVCTVTDL